MKTISSLYNSKIVWSASELSLYNFQLNADRKSLLPLAVLCSFLSIHPITDSVARMLQELYLFHPYECML